MAVTLLVSKLEISREVSAMQKENILPMFVTFDVSKPERSRLSPIYP